MRHVFAAAALLATVSTAGAQTPLGTGFTYQGRLTDAGGPATGSYDLQLILFDAAAGGSQVGPTLLRDDVAVTDGLFTLSLDFGTAFAGSKRWLQVGVRPGASTGAYSLLAPRQELTPAPNASFSAATPWTGIAGKPAGFADDVDNDSGGDITGVTAGTGLSGGGTTGGVSLAVDPAAVQSRVTGTCPAGSSVRLVNQDGTVACELDDNSGGDVTGVAAGTGLTGGGTSGDLTLSVNPAAVQTRVGSTCPAGSSIRVVNQDGTVACEADDDTLGWGLAGNAGTTPGTNFLGTTDNQTLELRVNGRLAFRLEPTAGEPGVNIVAGHAGNVVLAGAAGAVISGGASNSITDNFGTVGGGSGNRAGDGQGTPLDAPWATVGGGLNNRADGHRSTVGGGEQNSVERIAVAATIGGGYSNRANGPDATVAGGSRNTAGELGTVGGGAINQASGNAATVGGGTVNVASSRLTTVAGGTNNVASGEYATVPGGFFNQAGGYSSFAAGYGAKVRDATQSGAEGGDAGTFVWADSTSVSFASTGPNQFLVRAAGGVGVNTNAPSSALDVNGTATVTGFRLTTTPSAGAVLTADASGVGTWQTLSAVGDITGVEAGTGLSGGGTSGDVTLSVNPAAVQTRVGGTCPAGQAIRVVNQDGTVACEVDDNSGGDITGVAAGTGLTGGGAAGDVSVAVNFGGNGSAASASRSDHDHFADVWTGAEGFDGLTIENNSIGRAAFLGRSNGATGFSDGVFGATLSVQGRGTVGYATHATGANYGVWGQSDSVNGRGVYGLAAAGSGVNYGVYGQTNSASGYAGYFQGRLHAETGSVTTGGVNTAMSAFSTEPISFARALYARADSTSGRGVHALASAASGLTYGVYSENASTRGIGVLGYAHALSGVTYGVYGAVDSPAGFAGYFGGNVHVAGTLSKGAGAFRIDHPLDPENKYLYHSFVESPDMKNIYDGVVTTGNDGFATVELPEWFEALNRDFRYQLTVLGDGDWARARVFRKIAGNRFVIQTDLPGTEVSWQVTGIRQDAYAEKHRIPVEQDKPADERGTYLHPHGWER